MRKADAPSSPGKSRKTQLQELGGVVTATYYGHSFSLCGLRAADRFFRSASAEETSAVQVRGGTCLTRYHDPIPSPPAAKV